MSLALAVVIMRSSRCQAVRCESPPSVNQSAGLTSVNPYALQAAMQPQTNAINIVSFLIIEFLRKGRANWQFALSSQKIALEETGQTASLPYFRAAIFILPGVSTRHEASSKDARFFIASERRPTADVAVGRAKVRVIGDVEEIRPKLQIEHGLS